MSADVKGVLLKAGKSLLTSSLTGFSLFAPIKYELGSDFGFTPDENDTVPRGTVVYTGSALEVQSRQLSEDTARYVITVPETEGPFSFGNIVLYGSMWNADPIPLFSVVLPFLYTKEKSNATVSTGTQYPIPGNRFVVNIAIKHSLEATTVNVTVATPLFSSLAYFTDNTNYPPPALNPWTTFVLHNDTRTSMPAFVVTRGDGTQWGIPTWQSIRDPKFGVADGGQCGDAYAPTGMTFLWGQTYLTPAAAYKGTIGGTSYTMPSFNFIGNLGGLGYT